MLIAAPYTRATTVQTATPQSTVTQSVQAQIAPASATWTALASLPIGTRLRITMKSGDKLKGIFSSASDDSLVLFVKKQERLIRREDVRRVESLSGSVGGATVTGVLIGGATGAAVGGITGGLVGAEDDNAASVAAAGVVILGGLGATIGAGVGALVGAARRKRTLIYQAP